LENRCLLSGLTIPLNPVNERPITDFEFTQIPTPRLVLGLRGTLEVFAPNTSDRIDVSVQNIDGANRIMVTVNDRSRAVRLRDVKRITIIGDGGFDDPRFFPQRGADRITVSGPVEFLNNRRVLIFGDNVNPAEAQVDQFGTRFNFDGNDTIFGSDARDTIVAGGGNNFVEGGNGNDSITSLEGADTIGGGGGNDTVSSGPGIDSITGGNGNDSLDGGADADTIEGGNGNDVINLGAFSSGLILNLANGGDGNDTIVGSNQVDRIFGGAGDDSIDGGTSDDSIFAGPGNDSVHGGIGNDTIYGEEGDDTLKGDQGFINGRSQPNDSEISHDRIYGGPGNDYLWGESGDDQLNGNDGSDILLGQYGNDSLDGGAGNDYLNGHEGFDRIVGGSGRDTYNRADLQPASEDGFGFSDPAFRAGQTDFRSRQDNPNLDVRPYRLTFQIDRPDNTKETQGVFEFDILP